jgi:hypothetical protein
MFAMTARTDDYSKAVKFATEYRFQPRLDEFIQTFQKHRDTENVILLLGGAASQLLRADQPYDQVATPSQYFFDPVWLDIGIAFPNGDATLLPIDRRDMDKDEQVIVADGDIQFYLMNIRPYRKAVKFFTDQKLNLLLFSWDWRRDIDIAVDNLKWVIHEFFRRAAPTEEQKKKTFLVGHSMGGMVAKLFCTRHPDVSAELGGFISVGTPFYGYINQLQRIYEGVSELNQYYPPSPRTTAQIYSSFTGLYSLLPIDQSTYTNVGKDLGLTSYPVTDGHGNAVDPFDVTKPKPYPKWFRVEDLPAALALRIELASPLISDLKVFHLRTVKADPPTLVAATWKQDPYDPDKSPSPIEVKPGPGDETIPYWSSRLASTPRDPSCDFPSGEHSTLMEQNFVLRKILDIVTDGKRHITKEEFDRKYGPNPTVATPAELEQYRREVPIRKISEPLARRILQNLLM